MPAGLWLAAALLVASASGAHAQELAKVAVIPLTTFSADPVPTAEMNRSLVERLSVTGVYTGILVPEPPGGCAEAACAVEAAKAIGAKFAVFGRLTELDAQHWVLSATMVEVPGGTTVRTVTAAQSGTPSFRFLDAATRLYTEEQPVAAAPAAPKVEESPEQLQYEHDRNIWRTKWILGLGLAALFAAGSADQADQVSSYNKKNSDLASQASQATSLTQFNSLKQQIADNKSKAQQAADLSNTLAGVATALAIYGGYELFFKKPQAPAGVAFEFTPVPTPGGVTVALSVGF